MDENEIMNDVEVIDEVEETEDTEESGGLSKTVIGVAGAAVAGVAAGVIARKLHVVQRAKDFIDKRRVEHAQKVLEDYEKSSYVYPNDSKDSEDSE